MTKTSDQSSAARTDALKRTIESHAGMPAENVARGGRSLAEETERFLQDAQATHAAATPQEK